MPFQPGHQLSVGNRNVRVIDQTIRKIIARDQFEADARKCKSRLERAIDAQLDKAAEGSLDSLDWLTCRLEGKAHQTQSVDVVKTEIKSFTISELAAIISERHEKLVGVGEGAGVAIEGVVGTEGGVLELSPPTNSLSTNSLLQDSQLADVKLDENS